MWHTSTTHLTQVRVTLSNCRETRTLLCVALCLTATAWKPILTYKSHPLLSIQQFAQADHQQLLALPAANKTHWIFVPLSLSQTPVYTTRWDHTQGGIVYDVVGLFTYSLYQPATKWLSWLGQCRVYGTCHLNSQIWLPVTYLVTNAALVSTELLLNNLSKYSNILCWVKQQTLLKTNVCLHVKK